MDTLRTFEVFKRRPEEFGGVQYREVEGREEAMTRICAARWCGNPGFGQIIDGSGYRILCASHLLRLYMTMYVLLGNPMYHDDAQAQAKRLGIDWGVMLRERPVPEPIKPDEFRCILCGGQMASETVGMLSGRRWVHTCGEPKGTTPDPGADDNNLPIGLCSNKEDHDAHTVTEGSLAPFWCSADQSQREPWRSEQRRVHGEV